MDLMILNTDLDAISVIDSYKSLIWTDRYYKCGDFELFSSMNKDIISHIKQDYYLQSRHSEHVMIVEELRIESDVEDGANIVITGRSLESILDRRIIWGQVTISGNLQNGIKSLLDICIISPDDENRKIPNFIFEESTDPAITELEIEAQYTGDNLYEVIRIICEEMGIGFKVTLNDNKQFVFKLYSGVDRSYEQTEVPFVIFSPNFENIVNSNYVESKSYLKNVTLIGGEGEGANRKYSAIAIEECSGLNRREIFTDARDISSDVGDGKTLTDSEYYAQLDQRGFENLAENTSITYFEGQVETTIMFKYGVDFFDGDIVQIENEYGHNNRARIIEMITSINSEGTSTYPTLETL